MADEPKTTVENSEGKSGCASVNVSGARWEYLTVGMELCWPDEEQKKLNELGAQGWELVACIRLPNETRFYMKRQNDQALP